MTRAKGKAYVQAKHPDARAERQRTNGGRAYWLIRLRSSSAVVGNGDTQAAAWRNAAVKIQIAESERAGGVA